MESIFFNGISWIENRRGFGEFTMSELAYDECVSASGLHDGGWIVWKRAAQSPQPAVQDNQMQTDMKSETIPAPPVGVQSRPYSEKWWQNHAELDEWCRERDRLIMDASSVNAALNADLVEEVRYLRSVRTYLEERVKSDEICIEALKKMVSMGADAEDAAESKLSELQKENLQNVTPKEDNSTLPTGPSDVKSLGAGTVSTAALESALEKQWIADGSTNSFKTWLIHQLSKRDIVICHIEERRKAAEAKCAEQTAQIELGKGEKG